MGTEGNINQRGENMSRRQSFQIPGVHHAAPIPYGARVGNVVYSSAIQGIDAATGELSEDVAEQAKHCFENLRTFLRVAGATTGDIVRMTCFLKDLNDREVLNKEWLAMFPDENDRPARHTSSYDPPRGMKVQIEVMAVVDD
jgi:2-iminobutanoate/2-iminopropanoate deaminase